MNTTIHIPSIGEILTVMGIFLLSAVVYVSVGIVGVLIEKGREKHR